jgi:DNA-binding CsgD family transcriptional regulator/GAF domain-containing protein
VTSSVLTTTSWQHGIATCMQVLTAEACAELASFPAAGGPPPTGAPRLGSETADGYLTTPELADLALGFAAALGELRKRTSVPDPTSSRIHASLERMRMMSTSAEIIAAAAEQLCVACGFDRAMVSRLDGSTWIPQTLHVVGAGDRSAARLRAFARGLRIRLVAPMPEVEIVRRRTPMLVADAQADPRTFRPLVERSGTRVYVVAPLVVDAAVIGFLHADTHTSGRPLTAIDRDNLQTFTEGFGLVVERAVLAERLALQRVQIAGAFAETEVLIDELCGSPVALARAKRRAPSGASGMTLGMSSVVQGRRPDPAASEFTARQHEVLVLLAAGATNAEIADQLTVAETTVKSHVKHILRKLGAANRSEAIARYLRCTYSTAAASTGAVR